MSEDILHVPIGGSGKYNKVEIEALCAMLHHEGWPVFVKWLKDRKDALLYMGMDENENDHVRCSRIGRAKEDDVIADMMKRWVEESRKDFADKAGTVPTPA